MSRLLVTGGRLQPECFVVHFYRRGTGYYPCLIARNCAHNEAYLRSLVEFMQHKVPHAKVPR
jgi:hypothetical protein